MAQARLRVTAQAFGTGTELIAANLTADGGHLEVDAVALLEANAKVRSSLENGPEAAIIHVRELAASHSSLDRIAAAFGAQPARRRVVAYARACARYQALGSLKFCLPDTLRPHLADSLGDPELVDALLAPDAPSLWSVISGRELALARLRLDGPSDAYRRRLDAYRRAYGYLQAEDVDFRAHESLEAIDARLAILGAAGPAALAADRRRLTR
ncbi:MAG: hypothetical protein ACRD12_00625, partial [Acidimicrobiales bacterium]